MGLKLFLGFTILSLARSQQVGTQLAETHPSLTWQTCTGPNKCTTNNGKIVVDSNWRWVHSVTDTTNCYTGNTWDTTLCPDDVTCAANCALDGADYTGTYGATATGNALTLNFVTHAYTTNVGSRMYLMDTDTSYEMFQLLNKEFTFDVDVSNLPCGLNGALYLVSMDKDGGMAKYPTNKAGAKYGTGYCDSQCPRDLKFINGQGNSVGWTPSSNDPNAGVGNHGSCCAEMDIWEANSISSAYTPHPCSPISQNICNGNSCGGTYSTDRYGGTCDPDGCDFNSYRQGDTSFYGPGKTVDTSSKFTVVTQFIGSPLTEIRRFYVQNGVLIPNSQSTIAGVSGNSITPGFCKAQKTAFANQDTFDAKGGFTTMSSALKTGMVLVMSVWDDHNSDMLWLDSTYPVGSTGPGASRGTCATSSGVPAVVEAGSAGASVTFSNIKVGPINSTYSASSIANPGPPVGSSATSVPSGTKVSPPGTSVPTGTKVTPPGTTLSTGTKVSSPGTTVPTKTTVNPNLPTGFVSTSGTGFVLDGKPFSFVGSNAYWADTISSTDLDSLFSQMNAAGMKVLRIFGWGDNVGGPNSNSFQYWSGSNNTPNPAAFAAHMDPIITAAEKAGIKLVIPMIGNWGASVSLYIQQIVGSKGTHDTFYSNQQIIAAYKKYVNFFVNRYKSSPAIFAWELMNEPDCTGDDNRGASSACTNALLTSWVTTMSSYIKSIDSNHMVTVGDEGWFTPADGFGSSSPYDSHGIDWTTNLKISTLDYGTVHLYPGSWGQTSDWGNTWIQQHGQKAAAIGKPVVLEEFGTGSNNRYNVLNGWLNTAYSAGFSGIQYWQFVGSFPSGYRSPDDGNGISTGESSYNLIKAMAAKMNARGGNTVSIGSISVSVSGPNKPVATAG